jgi:hypothetical protein
MHLVPRAQPNHRVQATAGSGRCPPSPARPVLGYEVRLGKGVMAVGT